MSTQGVTGDTLGYGAAELEGAQKEGEVEEGGQDRASHCTVSRNKVHTAAPLPNVFQGMSGRVPRLRSKLMQGIREHLRPRTLVLSWRSCYPIRGKDLPWDPNASLIVPSQLMLVCATWLRPLARCCCCSGSFGPHANT